MTESNTTLFGSKTLAVQFEDGHMGEVTVHQLKLRDYPRAAQLLGNEFEFVAFCCNAKVGVIQSLHPESYELVQAAAREVNEKGFFIYAARQIERGAANLKNLPPEMIEKMLSQKLSQIMPPTAGSSSMPR